MKLLKAGQMQLILEPIQKIEMNIRVIVPESVTVLSKIYHTLHVLW